MTRAGQYFVATVPALVVLGFFVSFANWIPQTRWEPPKKREITAAMAPGELARLGEAIVRERGCMACHTMEPGAGVKGGGRGPNLFNIASRRASGVPGGATNRTDYLVQALYEPTAYVVEGYAPIMPAVHAPPAKLAYEEVVAVVAYLQSLGGTPAVKVGDIPHPPKEGERVASAAQATGGGAPRSTAPDAIIERYGCRACHVIGGHGGNLAPSLERTGVQAAQRVPGQSAEAYLRQSLLDPNAYVGEGFTRGLMPADLGDRMTAREMEALVQYLLSLGR